MIRKVIGAVSVTVMGVFASLSSADAASAPQADPGFSERAADPAVWGPFSPRVTIVRVGGRAASNRCAWNGRWTYTGDGGQNYGYMVLKTQGPKARSLSGHYSGGGTSGTIWGNLNASCGHVWKGEYEDTSGLLNAGGHRTILNDDRRSFRGKYSTCATYWPFDRFCTYRWEGTKV